MSEPDLDHLKAARELMAKACGDYADGWSEHEGSLVTRFVVIAEVVRPDGGASLLEVYCAGTGDPERRCWRHDGMLWSTLNQPAGEA